MGDIVEGVFFAEYVDGDGGAAVACGALTHADTLFRGRREGPVAARGVD